MMPTTRVPAQQGVKGRGDDPLVAPDQPSGYTAQYLVYTVHHHLTLTRRLVSACEYRLTYDLGHDLPADVQVIRNAERR